MKYLECQDEIQIVGTVVTEPTFMYEATGKAFIGFEVSAKRVSTDTCDVLPILCNRDILPKDIKMGSKVSISGEFRVYNSERMLAYLGEKAKRAAYKVYVKHIEIVDESAVCVNTMKLKGYLSDVSEIRTTRSGDTVADAVVLFKRAIPFPNGDLRVDKYYINCIVWNDTLEKLKDAEWMQKVSVWGRMQVRPYTKVLDDGTTIESAAYELSANSVWFID